MITKIETPAEEKWILQGRLVGLWVSELRRTWKWAHRADGNRNCVVDLNEVTAGGDTLAKHVKAGRAIYRHRYLHQARASAEVSRMKPIKETQYAN